MIPGGEFYVATSGENYLAIDNGKVNINGIEGFWSFAKERLLKYHGVVAQKFPLYQRVRVPV